MNAVLKEDEASDIPAAERTPTMDDQNVAVFTALCHAVHIKTRWGRKEIFFGIAAWITENHQSVPLPLADAVLGCAVLHPEQDIRNICSKAWQELVAKNQNLKDCYTFENGAIDEPEVAFAKRNNWLDSPPAP